MADKKPKWEDTEPLWDETAPIEDPSWNDSAPIDESMASPIDAPESQRDSRPIEAAVQGVTSGALAGFYDEATGAVKAAAGSLTGEGNYSDLYPKYRDEKRAYLNNLKNNNPIVFSTSEMGGSIIPAFIPGFGAAAEASAARIGLSGVPAQRAAMAAGGATSALGHSEEQNFGGLLKDAVTGAGVGIMAPSVIQKGASFVGNRVRGAKDSFLNFLENVTGSDKSMMLKYLQNAPAVNAARPIDELTSDVVRGVKTLKNRTIEGSRKATEAIPDDYGIDPKLVYDRAIQIKKDLGKPITDQDASAIAEMGRIADRVKPRQATSPLGGNFYDSIENMKRAAAIEEITALNGKEMKKFIKNLDADIDRSDRAGEFMTPSHVSKVKFRQFLDDYLKSNDAYKFAMKDVAEDASALGLARQQFGKLDTTASRLKAASTRPEMKQEINQALGAMDQRLGTNYRNENDMRVIKDYFSQDMSGGRGLRNRMTGAFLGGSLGKAFGPVGMAYGSYQGAKLGSQLDKGGRKAAKTAIDWMIEAPQSPITSKMINTARSLGLTSDEIAKFMEKNGYIVGAGSAGLYSNLTEE